MAKTLLLPGITAPSIPRWENAPRRPTVLCFCPESSANEIEKYRQQLSEFQSGNIDLVLVSDPPAALQEMSAVPNCAIAQEFGACSAEGTLVPVVFVIDEERLIRRVYESNDTKTLPHPAAVLRAVRGLAGIPKPGPVTENDWCYGSRNAPVAVIEYSDYQCGHCADMHRLMNDLLPSYPGQVSLVHRHYPLRHSHPFAQLAAEAAEAAGAQGKFWGMHHALFEHSHELSEERIRSCGEQIGLNMHNFDGDLASRRFQSVVDNAAARARSERIKFPPVVFINRILYEGPRTREAICTSFDRLLACVESEPHTGSR